MFKSEKRILGIMNTSIFCIGLSFGLWAYLAYQAISMIIPDGGWRILALLGPILAGGVLGAWLGGNLHDHPKPGKAIRTIISIVTFTALYITLFQHITDYLNLRLFDNFYRSLVVLNLLLLVIPSCCFMLLICMTSAFNNRYVKNVGSAVGKNLAICKFGLDFAVFCLFFLPDYIPYIVFAAVVPLLLSRIALPFIHSLEKAKHA